VARRVFTDRVSRDRVATDWACIDIPAFPLQLLLRREPAWRDRPAAVVAQDKPNARILWLNERARGHGILPGMRYAAGLGLCADLCAGVVDTGEIAKSTGEIVERIRQFGPDIEGCEDEPGVFWTSARGLERLERSPRRWAEGIRGALLELRLDAGIVAGFSRFGTYALARALKEPMAWVLRDAREEHANSRRVALSRLPVDPDARDALFALGVRTLGDLLRLPADGLRDRFGKEVFRLHRLARGEENTPVQPVAEPPDLRESLVLDPDLASGERDVSRLLFAVKRMLDPLLARLAESRQALAVLVLELRLDRGDGRVERLKPADPTLDARQLLDLLLLRLEALKLQAGVVEMALQAEAVPATQKQLELFAAQPRRDPQAAKRAFARLRAEFGEDAVARARLRDGHLPEGSYEWQPLSGLPAPKPRLCRRVLVRRLRARPWALPHRPRHEEDGWQLRGRDDASVQSLRGPFVVSGGWWHHRQPRELRRDYYFAGTLKGEWLWVFRDRCKRRWFLHGRVE